MRKLMLLVDASSRGMGLAIADPLATSYNEAMLALTVCASSRSDTSKRLDAVVGASVDWITAQLDAHGGQLAGGVLEQPPPTVSAGHGHQLHSGWVVGLAGGLVLGRYGITPVLVDSSQRDGWRGDMLVECNRAGLPMTSPPRRRRASSSPFKMPRRKVDRGEGGAWVVSWPEHCKHEQSYLSYSDLMDNMQNTCRDCDAVAKRDHKMPLAAWRRREWKRRAVEAALHFYPELIQPVIAAARARARKPREHVGDYAGVADAADAAGLFFTVRHRRVGLDAFDLD